jgi:hypothetical protein
VALTEISLGFELRESGFDSTVLSGFRTRLLRGSAEQILFSALIEKA